MEYNSRSHTNIQARSLFSVLRYIHKMITYLPMNWYNASALIAQKERRITFKRMFLYRLGVLPNFNPTHINLILFEVTLRLGQRPKIMELNLLERPLIAEKHELLHDFHLLAVAVLLAHVEHLGDVEGTG